VGTNPSLTPQQRLLGGLYGALVGDALGVPVEFCRQSQLDRDPVRSMRADGVWNQPAGTWSDDGSLLLCAVDSLHNGFDVAKMGASFVGWMRNADWSAHGRVFDIGAATHDALNRIEAGYPAAMAGGADVDTNGNGSLMRILPVALRHAGSTPAALAELAMRASAITHAHPRSRLACAMYWLLAQRLLAGDPLLVADVRASSAFLRVLENFPSECTHFQRVLSDWPAKAPRQEVRSGGYVIETLEAAFWCLHQHADFASTVLAAVNLGHDTDTTGCVTGGLAGLLYGIESIPPDWLDALPRRAELGALFAKFLPTCG
jgi:ADP-ribosyl-[dinitrogen reductase] hydrolase